MHYRIKPGYTFRDSDDSVKGASETIELDDESAKLHAHKVELLPPDVQTSAPARDDDMGA